MAVGRSVILRYGVRVTVVVLVTLLIIATGLATENIGAGRRAALVAHASEAGWVRGDPEGKVTLLVFSDFQCPFCGQLEPVLSQLLAEYPDDLRIVFRNFPLPQHPLAMPAARAAEAAGEQGKFWEMHDRIFENQRDLKESDFDLFAEQLGLDVAQFDQAMNSPASLGKVMDDIQNAKDLKVSAMPAVFLDSRQLQSPFTLAKLRENMELEMNRR